MNVRAYNDGTVHVFAVGNNAALATLSVVPPLKGLIEKKLAQFYLVRRGKWRDDSWGSEAKFYFKRNSMRRKP